MSPGNSLGATATVADDLGCAPLPVGATVWSLAVEPIGAAIGSLPRVRITPVIQR
jgi:hypothetical protein